MQFWKRQPKSERTLMDWIIWGMRMLSAGIALLTTWQGWLVIGTTLATIGCAVGWWLATH